MRTQHSPALVLRRWLVAACLLGSAAGSSLAQSFKSGDLAPAKAPTTLQGRTQALNQIFSDYWQDQLQHNPEMASAVGDKRYDDQLSDYSASAYDQSLARGEQFIERLGAIDTTGMAAQLRLSKKLLVRDLVDQQESSVCKPWQTPVTQVSGPQLDLPLLVETLTFTNAEDYDHYLARLQKRRTRHASRLPDGS